METSNKKNMALKLELWLAAKQSGGVTPISSPLRPVIHTTSSHQRVSGFLTTFSTADGATKSFRKSFSRSIPTSDEDILKMSSSSIKAASSPLRTLSLDDVLTPVSTKINQFTIFSEVDNDENSKENYPCRDQNVTSNVIRPKVSKLCPSSTTTKCLLSDQPLKGATVSDKPQRKSISKSAPESLDHTEFTSGDYIPADHSEHYNGTLSAELKHSKLFVKPCRISLDTWDTFEVKAKFLQDELQAMTFLNSILEQRVNELEQTISQDRLDANESASNRGKKHKLELKRLALERSSYEDRANQMVTQMGEQMALLQTMAMGRIEVLENDLMTERHTAEALTQEVSGLKSILAGTRNHTTGHCGRNTDIEAADDASQGNIDTEKDIVSYARANENDTESEADYSLTDDAASDDEEDDDEESR